MDGNWIHKRIDDTRLNQYGRMVTTYRRITCEECNVNSIWWQNNKFKEEKVIRGRQRIENWGEQQI